MMKSLVPAAAVCVASLLASTARADDAGKTTLPVPYAQRPLTLPEMTLSPELGLPITHFEFGDFALNTFGLNLGASFGIIDDLTVDITPFTLLISRSDGTLFGGGNVTNTKVFYGTFRAGATYRFVKSDVADIGARLEFGGSGVTDAMHITAGLPILLRFAEIVRIDTGMFWTLGLPTNGASVDGGLSGVNLLALPIGGIGGFAGVPVDVTFQIVDALFAGIDTGFGIGSFQGTVTDSFFMPLGFHVGGTIAQNEAPLVDLTGNFAFPAFLLGADPNPPTTEVWQVGLNARAYISL